MQRFAVGKHNCVGVEFIMGSSMTNLLEKAFSEASRLSVEEQDELARWLLAELASEKRWEQAYSRGKNRLAELAREAVSEQEAGETEELNPDLL